MATTSKYNRSEIMKEAWNLYRTGYGTFSNCLKAAWRGAKFEMKQAMIVAKMEAEWAARCETNRKASANMTAEEVHFATMESYYANGVYSGD